MKPQVGSYLIVGLIVSLAGSSALSAQSTQPVPSTGPAAASAETRTLYAESLLLGQHYGEAVDQFEKALAENPQNRRARLGLVRAYFWGGNVEQAMKAIGPLVAKNPTPEVTALWRDILGASTSVAGLQALDQAIKTEPNNPELLQAHARLLISLGCFADATRELQELTAKYPSNSEMEVDLALAYFSADRYPETVEICKRYETDPTTAGHRARMILARSLLKTWRIGEANRILQLTREKDPPDPRVCLGLLTTWVLDPANSPVTVDECMNALAEPEMRKRVQTRGEVREWLFALIGELVSHVPTDERVDTANRLNDLLAHEGEMPAIRLAREALNQYADKGPEAVKPEVEWLVEAVNQNQVSPAAVHDAGDLLLSLFQGQSLVDICDALLAHDPQDVRAMLLRAEGLAITAQYKEAEKAYQGVLDILPQCTKAERGLARTYSWHRNFKKAEETYNNLIDRDPGDMVIRREAARSLGWDKKLNQSLDAFDKAAKAAESGPAGQEWHNLLEGERKAKKANWWLRENEARKDYKELLSLDPSDLEAHFDLAQVYARNRLWEEAAEQYTEILNIDARHRRARDALYMNGIYHEPSSTTSFSWGKFGGFGRLLDIATTHVIEKVQQEVAKRTDLSFTADLMSHKFDEWGGGTIGEQDYTLRLDHRFGLRTWGHISGGVALFDESDDDQRFIGDIALSHRPFGGLTLTAGYERQPWRMNRATVVEGIDQDHLYIKAFGNIDPWTDAWFEYGHSWLSGGEYEMPNRRAFQRARDTNFYTDDNSLDELKWGAAYRLSLFPKILQIEYRGFAWMFDHEVPTYYSPDFFMVNILRESWRHYLNNDQYVEMKQLYYEVGITESIDSEGVGGFGWDAAFGWDICHHFGIELKWSGNRSHTYDSDIVYAQVVMRF